jgi:hypothetical protein
MPAPIKHGKIFMKDASGNLVQIIPESASRTSISPGATASSSGVAGLVPSAAIDQKDRYLKGDGTWDEITEIVVTETAPTISDNGTVFFYIEDDNNGSNESSGGSEEPSADPQEPNEPEG